MNTSAVSQLDAILSTAGMDRLNNDDSVFIVKCNKAWDQSWKTLRGWIDQKQLLTSVEVSIMPGENMPDAKEIGFARKSVAVIDSIADGLWLGHAMIEDRLRCHMQPVLDTRGKVYGYEAFARLQATNGEMMSGGKIFTASRQLNVEHLIDRVLHVQAIKTFIQSDMEGYLFVNFVPGFIHRPEKYLEGLTEAAKVYNMPPKSIVLEFTKAETPRDALHLRGIFEFCRAKGYSVSLDDINSVAVATRLIEVIKPDFMKLDMGLVRAIKKPSEHGIIKDLVQLAHNANCQVIAEGVESEDVHQLLKESGVDLFQGYLFAAPSEAVVRKQVI
jgi:EAL domain-containing protein (putative c-di-GMP-specific phosphodiesterase class I)